MSKQEELFNREIIDVIAKIEFPYVRVYFYQYGTPEYWKELEKQLNSEIDSFESFIRDHRSRDTYQISTEKKYVLLCKFCGYEYPDDFKGIPDCCDEIIEAQKIKIESIK